MGKHVTRMQDGIDDIGINSIGKRSVLAMRSM